ncbi:tetratricopeptide repeat-containing sulfotransferase family protein [Phenylobacterium montanum]|uniref:Sulfotransferase n=1 Tax=Phenylobacterium montanum TaxID=2823693 RepID=A0A975G1G4_9CAUL|nr:sulfotransferase [Caulobacter sp. S6]QUD88752.1 sulfotransferase [Caulobacter sp. S6]
MSKRPGPTAAEQLAARAREALAAGRLDEARAIGLRAIQVDPDCAMAFHAVGDVAAAVGALEPATQYLRRAHELDPNDPVPLARLSTVLIGLNRLAEARAVVRQALALKPRDAFSLETLAITLTRTGDYAEAVRLLERVVTLAPRNTGALYNLGLARQYIGEIDGAGRALRRVLELDPGHGGAWRVLVELTPQSPANNHQHTLEALFRQAESDTQRALPLGHALAKTAEDLGQYEQALEWLTRAKAARRRVVPYDPARDEALFAAAAETGGAPGAANGEAGPIFVVGLPRSGTTLVDRILSSHPEVGSIGEQYAFPLLLKQAAATPGLHLADPAAIRAAGAIDLPALGRAYMDQARAILPDRPRLTDKLPFNFFYAGLILQALPSARIVCLRRDPMDACLSNYRQLFGRDSPFHDYAYDLADIARYVAAFERLAAHWRRALPADRYFEITYERLVADQEGETRRLLAFCGLDWDPRCLDFHENRAGVATASVVQVRQPLFSSSIGRWRRYGPGLAAAEAVLAEAGLLPA